MYLYGSIERYQKPFTPFVENGSGRSLPAGKFCNSDLSKNGARISGAALSNVRPAVLAEILNQCLKVAKGKALLRVSEGKVRAVHSAEKNGYQLYIPYQKYLCLPVFTYVESIKKSTFLEGYADQTMVSATWQIRRSALWRKCMEKSWKSMGEQVKEKLTATIGILVL